MKEPREDSHFCRHNSDLQSRHGANRKMEKDAQRCSVYFCNRKLEKMSNYRGRRIIK